MHSCSIEIGAPDAMEELHSTSSDEELDQAASTAHLGQADPSQAPGQAGLLQIAWSPIVSGAEWQLSPSRAGVERELSGKRKRPLRSRKARETNQRHVTFYHVMTCLAATLN